MIQVRQDCIYRRRRSLEIREDIPSQVSIRQRNAGIILPATMDMNKLFHITVDHGLDGVNFVVALTQRNLEWTRSTFDAFIGQPQTILKPRARDD